MATENWNSLQELLIDRSVWHLSVPVSPGRSTLFHWSLALESPLPLTLIYPVLNSQSSVQVPGSLPMKQLQPQFRLSLSLTWVPLCPTQAIASLILTCGFPDNSLPLACQFHMVQPSGYSWNIGGKILGHKHFKIQQNVCELVSTFSSGVWTSRDLAEEGTTPRFSFSTLLFPLQAMIPFSSLVLCSNCFFQSQGSSCSACLSSCLRTDISSSLF